MIVNFNPNVSNCKKQKTCFGNERSANLVKNSIEAALAAKDPKLKINVPQAVERILIALKTEDKAGKSILKRFMNSLVVKN